MTGAMKYKSASLDDMRAFRDSDDWVFEQKVDGTHTLIRMEPGREPQFLSRSGGPLKHTAAAQHFHRLRRDLEQLDIAETVILDGEIVCESGHLWLYDIMVEAPFEDRRNILELIFHPDVGSRGLSAAERVHLLPQARTREEKDRLANELLRRRAEGVMTKRLDGLYVPDGRVDHALKLKFTKTADVVVRERNTGGKANAKIGVYRDGELVGCGNLTMIGKYDAQPGEVIEIRYLYLGNGGHLYQPRLLRPRPDKRPEECTWDQLIPTSREVIQL